VIGSGPGEVDVVALKHDLIEGIEKHPVMALVDELGTALVEDRERVPHDD
jgi:hypothetical protein